ncbi:MAG: DUF4157 domain-containing protein [Nostoc desertorum CM1-VF14]|jgi:hypothetical protein|nr:DUF4157 domain-containing protein [Nostoc desertorum CM1-VF14]
MNKRSHIHKKAESSASNPALSNLQSRSRILQAQPQSDKHLTQTEIETQEFQQHYSEATKLKLQAKYGTITPEGQERLTILQAKMSGTLHRRLQHASSNSSNFANIPISRPDAPLQQAVQTKLTTGEPGDKYEQEADRVAAQVVKQINAPVSRQAGQSHPVQRGEVSEEERKLQMKPMLQLRSAKVGMTAAPEVEASIKQARGSGQPLAAKIRQPMEQAFGSDFSSVKVHTDTQADQLNQSIQAKAFTTGRDVFFRQGAYEPGSQGGQELLAHELTHVIQQNGGEVQRSPQLYPTPEIPNTFGDDRAIQTKGEMVPNRQILSEEQHNQTDVPVRLKFNVGNLSVFSTNDSQISIQMERENEFQEDPENFMANNVVLFSYFSGLKKKYNDVFSKIGDAVAQKDIENNLGKLMQDNSSDLSFSLENSGNQAVDKKPIYYVAPAVGLLNDNELKKLFKLPNNSFHPNVEDFVKAFKAKEGGGYIKASYVPYFFNNPNLQKNGNLDENSFENVGSAIIDPEVTNFVFTDAMNGCAYAITEVEGDTVKKFQAWHFQSETDNWKQASHFRATKAIRDWFGVNDYYIGDGKTNLAATNIIWKKGEGEWNMLSQKNIVPLNSNDEILFKESTSTKLNVSDKISKDKLDKTLSSLLKAAKASMVEDINAANVAITALVVDETKEKASTAKLNVKDTSMSQGEEQEIKKVAKNAATKSSQSNRSVFTDLAEMDLKIAKIKCKGIIFGFNYDKTQTIETKNQYITRANKLVEEMRSLGELASQDQVTNDEKDNNANLLSQLQDIQFYYDIFEDYDKYNEIKKIIDLINRVNNVKEKVIMQEERFKVEKERINGN